MSSRVCGGVLRLVMLMFCVSVLVCVGQSVSVASANGVWWGIDSGSWPSYLPPAGQGRVIVTVQNRGYEDAEGALSPVVVKDLLPEGLRVSSVEGVAGKHMGTFGFHGNLECNIDRLTSSHDEIECQFGGVLPPFEQIEIKITVTNKTAVTGEPNLVSVIGGGAPGEVSAARAITVGEETPFGIENFELLSEEEGGVISTQAGKHPFQFTGVVTLNTSKLANDPENQEPAGLPKEAIINLPPGLLGNPTAFPQCTTAQFNNEVKTPTNGNHNECGPQTAVGIATVTFNAPGGGTRLDTRTVPVFNLTPLPGEPARFGLEVIGARAYLDAAVRTGSDYGVTLKVSDIPEVIGLLSSKVTFWGVPGAKAHDQSRGWECILGEDSCRPSDEAQPVPFLSLPPSCTGSLKGTARVNSWAEPKPSSPEQAPLYTEYDLKGLAGCSRLQFAPEIQVAPDTPEASTPTGLGVLVHVPQAATLNPNGLAESTVRNTTVALPEGVVVNPGGADGLEACSLAQIGYEGKGPGDPDMNLFTPTVGSPFCPNASKIGTLEIETPLLPNPLKGAVYLAAQTVNPFGSLIAMYLVAEDQVSGTLVKLAGEVSLDEGTGRLVSTFKDTPQLPFEDLRLHFFGEGRAPLGTPALCGSYTTVATFAPWSGSTPSQATSTFAISTGPKGAPCPNLAGGGSKSSLPFSPSLTAGSSNIEAGAFTPFSTTLSREDGEQDIQAVQFHLPPGLSGDLSTVQLCPEPQASQGTCGSNSLIGETTVSVGLGGNPFSVTGGKVYLTGPYEGAPFGLSIVNPAKAGPFDLGKGSCDCVLVRARIEVDRKTADLTITTDNSGPYSIPTMLDGIPLQIRHINVTIARPGFTFNPTSCARSSIEATLSSAYNARRSVSVPFQVTNCATLAFKPRFTASATGKNSRKNGAGLRAKLSYPRAAWGTQADIAEVKVDLPKRLPSRLTTLQKACTDTVFDRNPASCPSASKVGTAFARTPIIPVPLAGPAYFVSHGSAKFPELVIVLQGYGVTINLGGETFISKTGVTSSTFRTVPDVPVSTFELSLPQGPYSALAANGNLCKTKLIMQTAFTAQNGLVIHRPIKMSATGCPKKKSTKAKKHKKKHKKKH